MDTQLDMFRVKPWPSSKMTRSTRSHGGRELSSWIQEIGPNWTNFFRGSSRPCAFPMKMTMDDNLESMWHSRYFCNILPLFPAWVLVVEAWRACHGWEKSVEIISFAIQSHPEPGLCDWTWDIFVGRILLVYQIPFDSCDVVRCLFLDILD